MNKEELLKLKEKLSQLDKRRVGAGVLAGLIASTPLLSSAEEVIPTNDQDSEYIDTNASNAVTMTDEEILAASKSEKVYNLDLGDFKPVSQEKKVNPITLESYFAGVSQVTKYLMERFDLQDEESRTKLIQRVECLYFVENIDYFKEELEQELVDGININSEFYKILFKTDTSIGEVETIESAKELMKEIIEYNDNKIRETNNIDDLINYSILCFNENDRKVIDTAFKHWFNAHKNNTYDMDGELFEAFKIITTLNSVENLENADNGVVASRRFIQEGVGHNVMQVIRDYLNAKYKNRLREYFIAESLNEKIWRVREDKVLFKDYNCLNDLEQWVFVYGQLYEFCVRRVDNDFTRALQRTNETPDEVSISYNRSLKEQITIEDFFSDVNNINGKISNYMKYDDEAMKKALLQQINCLYFVSNCEFAKDIEQELVNGVEVNGEIVTPIFITDMSKTNDMSGFQNFAYANYLLNNISDYNHDMVRETKDFEKVIDISIFCHDEKEKEYVHYLEELWFESHKGKTYNFEKFDELFNELINIDSNLSIGTKWLIYVGITDYAMQVLRDYFQKYYTNEELSKYFKIGELNRGQHYLKDGLKLNKDSSDKLEKCVYYFRELWKIFYDNSCDEIFEYFGEVCKVKTK